MSEETNVPPVADSTLPPTAPEGSVPSEPAVPTVPVEPPQEQAPAAPIAPETTTESTPTPPKSWVGGHTVNAGVDTGLRGKKK